MKRTSASLLVGLTLTFAALHCPANERSLGGNSSPERAGLEVEWTSQVDLRPGGRIVDTALVIDENNSTTFYAIEYGSRQELISQHDLNAFGEPYGIEGAQAQAELRKEILTKELASVGREVEVKINTYTLPDSTLFTVTDTGLVSSINADTGEVHWTQRVGTRVHPTIGLGASSRFVAVVNGINIYCLDAKTGKILFDQKCRGIASGSPAVGGENPKERDEADGFIYVPLNNGDLQKFLIGTSGLSGGVYKGIGRPTARALVTDTTVSWPTYQGHYNVAKREGKEKNAIAYRLRSYDPIVSGGKALGSLLFVSSLDGIVYAIEEKTGNVYWEFASGARIAQSPIPVGNAVFVITEADELFKLDIQTGLPVAGWETPVPGIGQYVGASEDRLYAMDRVGNLLALSLENGQQQGSVRLNDLAYILPNYKSDRLYVGFSSGRFLCLREIGKSQPFFHSEEVKEAVFEESPAGMEQKAAQEAAEDDPFRVFDAKPKGDDGGAADDPFNDPFAPSKKTDAGAGQNNSGDPFAPSRSTKPGGNSGGGADDDPFK